MSGSSTGLPINQSCKTYIQKWFSVSDRAFSVSWPKQSKPLQAGWPFVIYFDFMTPTGLSQLWQNVPADFIAGVSEKTPDVGIDGQAWYYLQAFFHGCLKNGVAVVCLSQLEPDTLRYMPTSAEAKTAGYEYTCDDSEGDSQGMCWTKGNDEQAYLNDVISFLKRGIPSEDGARVSFDISRVSCVGYSVGAQMASRVLESYSDILPPGAVIRSAILIAGGSFFCYAYESSDELPPVFSPCAHAEDRGCCPNNITEPRYMKTGAGKPPVLLLQAKDDHYADTEAAAKYIRAVQKTGGSSACWISYEGSLHGASPEQAGASVAFVINTLNSQDR